LCEKRIVVGRPERISIRTVWLTDARKSHVQHSGVLINMYIRVFKVDSTRLLPYCRSKFIIICHRASPIFNNRRTRAFERDAYTVYQVRAVESRSWFIKSTLYTNTSKLRYVLSRGQCKFSERRSYLL